MAHSNRYVYTFRRETRTRLIPNTDSDPSSITLDAANQTSPSSLENGSQSVNNVDQHVANLVSPPVNEEINPVSILVQPQIATYIEANTGESPHVSIKSRGPASLPNSTEVLGESPRAIRFVEAADDQKQARFGEQLAHNPRGLFKMTGRKATPHPVKIATSLVEEGG